MKQTTSPEKGRDNTSPLQIGLLVGLAFFVGTAITQTFFTEDYSFILLVSILVAVLSGMTSYLVLTLIEG